MYPAKVGILTAGGLAPCLNASVGMLIAQYSRVSPETEIICYRAGYKGLLLGDSIPVTEAVRQRADVLLRFGGSAIGNSRVKLSNRDDCVRRGYVQPHQDPRQVAADQLVKDGVDVLHTIGGDDTSTAAADLARYLKSNDYDLTVIGLPKTIDNDVYPISQSLGAWTAAESGAVYFQNVVAEHSANPRMLVVHEVMGRSSGWLTAATAHRYMQLLGDEWLPELGLHRDMHTIHGVYLPEMSVDLNAEAERLKAMMDTLGNVNLFVSEGAGVADIVKQMEADGQAVPRDAFGHVKLDAINPGQYFATAIAERIGAEKVLVQKSGYFSRAAAPNDADLKLIGSCVDVAVDAACNRQSGVVGNDEDQANALRIIEFDRIAGGKPFDTSATWFKELLVLTGQDQSVLLTPDRLKPSSTSGNVA